MYKFSPIDKYALINLIKNQIFFNNSSNLNDPFDFCHDIKTDLISNEKFAEYYKKTLNREFDETTLLEILNNTISKKDFYNFFNKHCDLIFENKTLLSKHDLLEKFKKNPDIYFNECKEFFSKKKSGVDKVTDDEIYKMRQRRSDVGLCCFSKTNSNIQMWSHYADKHQGFCLQFDSNFYPFNKKREVIYKEKIPMVSIDEILKKNSDEILNNFYFYKSILWFKEHELRLINKEPNKSYGYSVQSLKAIYFGLRTKQIDIDLISTIIESKNMTVKLYNMEKTNNTFDIKPKEFFIK